MEPEQFPEVRFPVALPLRFNVAPQPASLGGNQGIGVGAPATAFDRPFASFGGPGGVFIAFVELHCILFGFLRIVTGLDPLAYP